MRGQWRKVRGSFSGQRKRERDHRGTKLKYHFLTRYAVSLRVVDLDFLRHKRTLSTQEMIEEDELIEDCKWLLLLEEGINKYSCAPSSVCPPPLPQKIKWMDWLLGVFVFPLSSPRPPRPLSFLLSFVLFHLIRRHVLLLLLLFSLCIPDFSPEFRDTKKAKGKKMEDEDEQEREREMR